MTSDKRMHVNEVRDIAAAWDSGKPLTALCGAIRTIDAARHDKLIRGRVVDACPDCLRIAGAMAATGQMQPLGEFSTADQIRKAAEPMSQAVTYTIKFSPRGRGSQGTPLAG